MSQIGIQAAFRKYGAKLKNVQWSVSSWTANDTLVVSLWAHHCRKGRDGTLEFSDLLNRWSGPGNQEFRSNIARAFAEKSPVQLVIASTVNTDHIESGQDASKVKKDFHIREDLIGQVVELDGEKYVFRFSKREISTR
jgi:hypothetical protein